jgi:predicted adenine nucleotide alpha hydrolase (AANH) superfamily ATPase
MAITSNLIVTAYDNENYNKDLEPYAALPEGQERCFICYRKRMGEAYDYAEKNGLRLFHDRHDDLAPKRLADPQ